MVWGARSSAGDARVAEGGGVWGGALGEGSGEGAVFDLKMVNFGAL